MAVTKIATCCYCGNKAALVLKGEVRHELACGTCGAPLRKLKMLRNAPAPVTAPAAAPTRPRPVKPVRKREKRKPNRPKKYSKFSKLRRKVFEEVWDVLEDIFD